MLSMVINSFEFKTSPYTSRSMIKLLAMAINNSVNGIPGNLRMLKRLARNKYNEGEFFLIFVKKGVLKIKTIIFLKKESICAIIGRKYGYQT